MTTLKPVELAREQLVAAQSEVQRLSQEIERLRRERAASLAAGAVDEANRIGSLIHEASIAYSLAGGGGGGALAEAQGAVNREERAIREARSRVADLTNAHNLLKQQSIEALDRAQSLTSSLTLVQQQLAESREQLLLLEPPEQPVAVPAPEPEPVPVERDPEWPQPARMVFDYGEGGSKHFDKDNNPVDANGRPLDLSEAPEAQPEPGREVDP